MSKLTALMSRVPKQLIASVVMLAAAVIIPAVVLAWGPDRPTFTGANPASYVTFNSITDNPQVGDERNFVRIRESGVGTYTDNVTLTPGKVYDVMVYYHNNAATNLNASGKGIAQGTTLKMEIPGIVNAGVNAAFTGTISATNATPTSVYDQAYGKNATDGQIALRYVSNSAKFTSNGKVNGQTLPDSLFTTGAKLGYDAQDGVLPGCAEYSGYVIFQMRVDQPNFTVKKQVSVDEGKTWVDDSVEAKAGSTVLYRIVYQNTGTNQQDNVSLDDTLPKGVSYVAGSSLIANSTTGGQYKATKDGITTNGYNAGSYQPKGNVYFKFSAKLPTEDKLSCGVNTLVNKARATTTSGYKEDTATVTIKKECKPVAKYTCDSLTVTKLERTKFEFETKYTVQNATLKNITYVVRNASGDEVYRGTNSTYTQTTVGKYSVQAIVTVTVDGSDKTVTSDGCKKEFEVVKEKTPAITIDKKVNGVEKAQVAVGEEFTYQLVVKNTGEVDLKNAVVSDPAPTNVQFISADKGTITDNKWSYTIAELKVGKSESFAIKAKVTKEVTGTIVNTACVDTPQIPGSPDDCDDAKVEVPKTPKIEVCELDTKKIVTIDESAFDSSKYSKDLNDCAEIPVTPVTPETPETPSELPQTGMSENILALTGLGALIASAAYYIASRRALGL